MSSFTVQHAMHKNDVVAIILRAARRDVEVGQVLYASDGSSWSVTGIGTQSMKAAQEGKLSVFARSKTGARLPRDGETLSTKVPDEDAA